MQLGFSLDGKPTDKQSSGTNFQRSNWQKVQFNTNLLKQRHRYHSENDGMIKTKWNLRALLKCKAFLIGEAFLKMGKVCGGVDHEVSKSEMFLLMDLGSGKSFYKNLIESPNLIKKLIPSRSPYYITCILSYCGKMWVCRSNSLPP